MTTQDASQAIVAAFESAMLFYCFLGVMRTGRIETATIAEKQAQAELVDTYELYDDFTQHVALFQVFAVSRVFCGSDPATVYQYFHVLGYCLARSIHQHGSAQ